MALEPAGVSLQAQGFADYIKKLERAEKEQRKVFDSQFKGTGKTFAQITKAARDYETQIRKTAQVQKQAEEESRAAAEKAKNAVIARIKAQQNALLAQRKAQKQVTLEAQKLAAAQKAAAAAQVQSFISSTRVIAAFIKQAAQAVFQLGKLGAQYQGQQVGLNNLSASFGQSGSAIQKAIQDASKGTLSGLQAINAANQGLLLGVAQTPEEFANLTNSALVLGRTLGLDATQSIEQFTSALGRQSLLILDNFGISAKQVNAEIERLAQADFGKARSELTEAQKQATFMKAALNIAGEAAATIGDEAGEAQASFDRLTAAAADFKTQLGEGVSDLNQTLGITEFLTKQIKSTTDTLQFSKGIGPSAEVNEQIKATEIGIKDLETSIERIKATQEGGILGALFGQTAEQDAAVIEKLEQRIGLLNQRLETLNLQKAAEDQKRFGDKTDDTASAVEDNTEAIKAYESALKQAQGLQLSFAREAEDTARKQGRALEDLAIKQTRAGEDTARKQAKSIAKLEQRQEKDRDKLLDSQIKRREKFEENSKKKIIKAQDDIAKERKEASDRRKRDQQKLQRELQQAQEKFNLSRLQSERRFNLQDRRLRAEGDILALQELRENRDLERQEETENFGQAQKERKQSAEEQQKQQAKDLQNRVNELKANLEDQRAELLASFDEQLVAQQAAQAEARAEQQQGFADEAIERQIALQREEEDRIRALERESEDRRISQRRQLEDLGIALAEQKEVTAQGVNAIAEEIEKVFGLDGTATNIITGFSKQSRSEFETLFEDIEDIVKKAEGIEQRRDTPLVALTGDTRRGAGGGFGDRTVGGIQAFQDGGVVGGPIGSPQIIQAHGGETVLPTHQQSFAMNAPVIPSQNLNVNMSGGFDITGGEVAGEKATQKAIVEMADAFEIVIKRIARQI